MFSLISMSLSYPYGSTQIVSEPPPIAYFRPTSTSFTVVMSNGFRFAAEPTSWVSTNSGKFKQVSALTKDDQLLLAMPTITYSYTGFGGVASSPLIMAQRNLYVKAMSSKLSDPNYGVAVNTTYPVTNLTPISLCYCLVSDKDCTDGGNLVPTPLVLIV